MTTGRINQVSRHLRRKSLVKPTTTGFFERSSNRGTSEESLNSTEEPKHEHEFPLDDDRNTDRSPPEDAFVNPAVSISKHHNTLSHTSILIAAVKSCPIQSIQLCCIALREQSSPCVLIQIQTNSTCMGGAEQPRSLFERISTHFARQPRNHRYQSSNHPKPAEANVVKSIQFFQDAGISHPAAGRNYLEPNLNSHPLE